MTFSRHALAGALALALMSAPTEAAEPVSVTLDWTPNTNFVGLYVAEALGLYEKAGLDVRIEPFKFGQTPGDIAAFGVLDFYTARAKGLDSVGVYAVVQTETGRLAYNGDISRPRDLSGKIYGGFGTTWEKAIIDTMIAKDGGDPQYKAAKLEGSVYDALRAGKIDFTLEVLTWQGVENALAGHPVKTFRYADYGIPDQHTIILAGDSKFLSSRPKVADAFLDATQAGYAYAAANPGEAAKMLIAAAPELAGQEALVNASMAKMVEGRFLAREDGTIGRFDEAMMLSLGDFLFAAGALVGPDGGALAKRPDFSTWFTNRYLD